MSLGKKISCPFCKTKLFTFNKTDISCPICKKKINTEKKYDDYENNYEDDDKLDELSDEELIDKVIPQQFYEIIEILNLLDDKSYDISEKNDEDHD